MLRSHSKSPFWGKSYYLYFSGLIFIVLIGCVPLKVTTTPSSINTEEVDLSFNDFEESSNQILVSPFSANFENALSSIHDKENKAFELYNSQALWKIIFPNRDVALKIKFSEFLGKDERDKILLSGVRYIVVINEFFVDYARDDCAAWPCYSEIQTAKCKWHLWSLENDGTIYTFLTEVQGKGRGGWIPAPYLGFFFPYTDPSIERAVLSEIDRELRTQINKTEQEHLPQLSLFRGEISQQYLYGQEQMAVFAVHDSVYMPKSEVASVYWAGSAGGHVISIDGKDINDLGWRNVIYSGGELLPGDHLFKIACQARRSPWPVEIEVVAELSPGHNYSIQCKSKSRALTSSEYAISIIDRDTGDLVAGRQPDVLKWTWSDFKRFLFEQQGTTGSKQKVIDTLSLPSGNTKTQDLLGELLLQDNILAFIVNPEMGGIIQPLSDYSQVAFGDKEHGFWFIQFNTEDVLLGDKYFEIPYQQCEVSYWGTGSSRLAEEYVARLCHIRIRATIIAEYFASIGKYYKAYQAIEFGFISFQKFLDNNSVIHNPDYDQEFLNKRIKEAKKELINKSHKIIEKYPEILIQVKQRFKVNSLEGLSLEQGDQAKNIVKVRLNIYKYFASLEDYLNAERTCSEFFGAEF